MKGSIPALMRKVGVVLVVAGATLLFTSGALRAQAATHHGSGAGTAAGTTTPGPTCAGQPGLDDPTNSTNKVLTSYYFAVTHAGVTTDVCSLFPNVRAGDVVTAFFRLSSGASQATRITLVSYTASKSSSSQRLFDCATYGVATGSCVSSTSTALTVTVPDCGFQIDFIYGDAAQSLTPGTYHDAFTWISGQLGDVRSGATCPAPGGPTPTPTPTLGTFNTPPSSQTSSGTPAGTGSGVLGVSTPSTGAGVVQMLLGLVLMGCGATSIVGGHWLRPRKR